MFSFDRFPTLRFILRYWKALLALIIFVVAFYFAYKHFKRVLKLPSTLSVLMALAAAGANWEMYTLGNGKDGDSFSAVIFKLAQGQPYIPFTYGMLGYHLFSGDSETLEAFRKGQEAGVYWPLKDKEQIEELVRKS